MIRFYSYKKELVFETTEEQGYADFYTKKTVIAYINYQKGNEEKLTLNFQVYESRLDDWYPLQFDDGDKGVVTYSKELTESGKYRLVLPTADNEEKIRIIAETEGDTNNLVEIYVFPMSATL